MGNEWREMERDMSFLLQLWEGMSSFSGREGKGFSLSRAGKAACHVSVVFYIFREFLE